MQSSSRKRFTASRRPQTAEFDGRPILTREIPGGAYATLTTEGQLWRLFLLWNRFRRQLRRDGIGVDAPVFEVYPDLLRDVPPDSERGALRYRVAASESAEP